jgi:HSP20 family protein
MKTDEKGRHVQHDEFCAEFDAMFVELAKRARTGRFEPNCDVHMSDDGDAVIVTVEIAGADPAELRVGVEERHMFIIGRRTKRDRSQLGSVFMKEIEYGDFVKKLHLPVPVAYTDANASYRDGMLTIHLPVSEGARLPEQRTEIRMTVRRVPV